LRGSDTAGAGVSVIPMRCRSKEQPAARMESLL
jgi:hypothetical protein